MAKSAVMSLKSLLPPRDKEIIRRDKKMIKREERKKKCVP